MQVGIPKNSEKYFWTEHSKFKMRQYGLSPQRVVRVIRNPQRTEEGIVSKTIACMQRAGSKKHPYEIWVMYQVKIFNSQFPISNKTLNPKLKNYKLKTTNQKLRIISAWRYPGISPKKDPIPEEILREIKGVI